ncbi:MAG: hypothetical protein M5U09_08425 [Gammaproteobacteria bacterium]|nr:hypothetical protein [Gammaproteobacteria bacterium]
MPHSRSACSRRGPLPTRTTPPRVRPHWRRRSRRSRAASSPTRVGETRARAALESVERDIARLLAERDALALKIGEVEKRIDELDRAHAEAGRELPALTDALADALRGQYRLRDALALPSCWNSRTLPPCSAS